MFRSKHRHYESLVYLGVLPVYEVEDGEKPSYSSLEYIKNADIELGRPDTCYPKDGQHKIIVVPHNCDYWIDDNKLVIRKDAEFCPRCYNLLVEEAGMTSCTTCMVIYEIK